MAERIYDSVGHDFDSDHVLHVDEDEAGNLAIIVIDGEQAATVKLDSNGARALRLAVQKWERKQ